MAESRETTTVRLHKDAKATFDGWLDQLKASGQPIPKREQVLSQLVTMLVELDDGTFANLLMRTYNEADRQVLARRVLERMSTAGETESDQSLDALARQASRAGLGEDEPPAGREKPGQNDEAPGPPHTGTDP